MKSSYLPVPTRSTRWTLARKMTSFRFPKTLLCFNIRVKRKYVFGQTSIRASIADPGPYTHKYKTFRSINNAYNK